MRLIAHRGNWKGKTEFENNPEYIESAIEEGFDVEVDVWYIDLALERMGLGLCHIGDYYLGHDCPQYKPNDVLANNKDRLWCHAKNLAALHQLLKEGYNCFWNEEGGDRYTLTSKRYVWAYDGNNKAILVYKGGKEYGICADDLRVYRG